MDLTAEIKAFCRKSGADCAGIADLVLIDGLPVIPSDLLVLYRYAVTVGIGLRNDIVDTIMNRPSAKYAKHCREVNQVLNDLSSRISHWIEEKGYKAEAIPASQKVDDEGLCGSISHKALARLAGLGWQGKSLLLVTPAFGPRVRLTSILTDMPLQPDSPLKNRCGTCTECTEACPAGAIKNVSTESHYATREEALHLDRCHHQLLEFQKLPEIGYTFCGVCIRVCPFGKKKSARKKKTAGQ